MPDTEENIWGHLLLSNFWFHEEIGCSLQKAVKAHTHEHKSYDYFPIWDILSPSKWWFHSYTVIITKKTQTLQASTVVAYGFMLEFWIWIAAARKNPPYTDNYPWSNSIFKVNH